MLFRVVLLALGLLGASAAVVETAAPTATKTQRREAHDASPTNQALRARDEEKTESSSTSVTTTTATIVVGGTTYLESGAYSFMTSLYSSVGANLDDFTRLNQPYSSDNPPKADATGEGESSSSDDDTSSEGEDSDTSGEGSDDNEGADESNAAEDKPTSASTWTVCVETVSGACDQWSSTVVTGGTQPTADPNASTKVDEPDSSNAAEDGSGNGSGADSEPEETGSAGGGGTSIATGANGECAVYSTVTSAGSTIVQGNRAACPTAAP